MKNFRILVYGLLLVTYAHAADDLAQEYYRLAQSYKELGNIDKAIECFKNAIQQDPNQFDIAFSFASTLVSANKIDDAIDMYRQTVVIRPDCPQAYYNLGVCLEQRNKNDEALTAFDQAIAYKTDYTKAYVQRGILLKKQGRDDEALESLKHAADLDNTDFETHWQLARIYKDRELFKDAVKHLRCAVELQPKSTKALVELANTLNMFDDTADECLHLYYRALEIEPRLIGALYNAGYTLKKRGDLAEAIIIYDKILEMQPNYALARFGRALAYLSLGDFERGWREYEWRWQAYNEAPKKFGQPIWDGSDLQGKKILVYAEQGLGDTLQFCRYLKLLKSRGAHVIFVVQKPLKKFLQSCEFIDEVITNGDTCPPFDVHIALMSLPFVCKTTLETIPAEMPYLKADPALVDYWAKHLAEDKNFKIGLCWQGNAHYRTAFLRQAVAAKSTNVNTFAALASVPGVSFYSLQKLDGEEQLSNLKDGFVVHQFGTDFDETHGRFMDTAAVMKNLDLVISVDTATCHMAGALGVPVWVPLPAPADWRWMLKRDDTPWYPTMRLFRQEKAGDWESVMNKIIYELQKLVRAKGYKDDHAVNHETTTHHAEKAVHENPGLNVNEGCASATVCNIKDASCAELTDRLALVMKQLHITNEKLRQSKESFMHQEYIDCVHTMSYLYNLKERIKQQLDVLDAMATKALIRSLN